MTDTTADGRIPRRAVLGWAAAGASSVLAGCDASAPTAAPAPVRSTPPEPAAHPSPPAPAQTGPAREITRGPGTRPQVALTFHGAGEPALAEKVLAALDKGGAQVTILAVGTWLAANPALARRITAAGHELGNHTYSHLTMPGLAEPEARREIERCRDLLTRLTGSPGRWFRPSGTQFSTPLIRRLAGAAGYPVCLSYDVDPRDYQDPGAAAVRSRTAASVRPGSIVSLHLGHPGTAAALPGIVADLRARGLTAVTVTDLLAP
ncbi:MAG: hypothetical protein QOJ50_551 [Cryptosporangiaceae bacterium]|nr:hypothetical protein [Cryptosporangiaceae bacterium]